MLAKANHASTMRLEVLHFGSEPPVRASEKDFVGEKLVQRGDVCAELSGTNTRFESDDLGICRANQDAGHGEDVRAAHGNEGYQLTRVADDGCVRKAMCVEVSRPPRQHRIEQCDRYRRRSPS
jgi:hypothetical protein